MLDPAALTPERNCDAPEHDPDADFSAPYAVDLGGHWQLIIFDSARASRPLDRTVPGDAAAFARYQAELEQVRRLAAAPNMHSIFVSHHPALGFATDGAGDLHFGTPALLEPMQALYGTQYYPPGVELSLHGHVHAFEAIAFASGQPPAIVAGHGGDKLDGAMPARIAAAYPAAVGVTIDFAAHASRFGYLVIDRLDTGWQLEAKAVDGSSLAHCFVVQRQLSCAAPTSVSRPRG